MIFHALVEPAAASTVPSRSSSTSAAVTRSGRPCHGARQTSATRAGAHGLAIALVLGVSEGGEDDALLGGHDRSEALAAPSDARNSPCCRIREVTTLWTAAEVIHKTRPAL